VEEKGIWYVFSALSPTATLSEELTTATKQGRIPRAILQGQGTEERKGRSEGEGALGVERGDLQGEGRELVSGKAQGKWQSSMYIDQSLFCEISAVLRPFLGCQKRENEKDSTP
jgi:hypothetical protein